MEPPSYSAPIQPVQARRTSFGLPPICNFSAATQGIQQWQAAGPQQAAVSSGSISSGLNRRGSIDGYHALPYASSNSMPLEQDRVHELLIKQQQQQHQLMQEHATGSSSGWLSSSSQASLPPQPMLSRRASVDVAAALLHTRRRSLEKNAPHKRASIDLSATTASSRYGDYPRPQQQHNSSRYSIDAGATATWARSSLFSSTAASGTTATAPQAAPRERRPSGRHSVDIGSSGNWMRSSLFSSTSAAPQVNSGLPTPVRRSPWAVDGTAAVHPPTIPESPMACNAASAAAAGYDAGFNAGVTAALQQQHQQHRAASHSPSVVGGQASQHQVWSSLPSAASAQQELPDGIMRTSSGGSNSSGGSTNSTYSRQQQLAMQSALYGSSSAGGSSGAAAADSQQQQQRQQQALAALKIVEEEVKHLTQLKAKLIKAASAAPAGSAAAAACDAALAKHEMAMSQALQARASLEMAAATALANMGSLDMDPEYEEYYAAADEAAYGTAIGTDTEDEYPFYPGADGNIGFGLQFRTASKISTMGVAAGNDTAHFNCSSAAAVVAATVESGSFTRRPSSSSSRRSVDVGSLQFQQQRMIDQAMLRDQHQQQHTLLHQQQLLLMAQLQRMSPSAASAAQPSESVQQKLQQLKTLQQMQAELKMMQHELAMSSRVSPRH